MSTPRPTPASSIEEALHQALDAEREAMDRAEADPSAGKPTRTPRGTQVPPVGPDAREKS